MKTHRVAVLGGRRGAAVRAYALDLRTAPVALCYVLPDWRYCGERLAGDDHPLGR